MNRRKSLKIIPIALFLAGVCFLGKGGYIHAKALTAQVLLKYAWQKTLSGETEVRPWPWADTWPIARLIVPEHNIDQIVLEGDTGTVLAFGPGRMLWSALPGEEGNTIISGHRDTNFKFLKNIQSEDTIIIETKGGMKHTFIVENLTVAKGDNISIPLETGSRLLTLVTCYPFKSIKAATKRFVVFAKQKNEVKI